MKSFVLILSAVSIVSFFGSCATEPPAAHDTLNDRWDRAHDTKGFTERVEDKYNWPNREEFR